MEQGNRANDKLNGHCGDLSTMHARVDGWTAYESEDDQQECLGEPGDHLAN